MQVRELSWDEVVTAGTVIFGPSFGSLAGGGAWRGELKSAYRRRALETHPDRAAQLGRSEAELLREFRAVAEAYELLVRLRAGAMPPPAPPPSRPPRARRPAPPRPAAAPAPARRASAERPAEASAQAAARRPGPNPPRPAATAGPAPAAGAAWGRARAAPADGRAAAARALPRRRLRLAEFLYYAGVVPWSDFVGAVAWQRAQRPAVGRIAVDFGFLSGREVAEILERRRREGGTGEPFGEFAVRRGYLTPFQLLALLGQQLRLQRPIGRYFAERGLVSDGALDDARAAVFRHNARHPL